MGQLARESGGSKPAGRQAEQEGPGLELDGAPTAAAGRRREAAAAAEAKTTAAKAAEATSYWRNLRPMGISTVRPLRGFFDCVHMLCAGRCALVVAHPAAQGECRRTDTHAPLGSLSFQNN